MSMGRRKQEKHDTPCVAPGEARSPGHPFYERLNRLLGSEGFDAFIEKQCSRFYAERMGRPSSAVYFRLPLIGYFEGIDSERGSIVRRATGESYDDFLVRLGQASGIETPMREDLAKINKMASARERTTTGPTRTIRTPRSPR